MEARVNTLSVFRAAWKETEEKLADSLKLDLYTRDPAFKSLRNAIREEWPRVGMLLKGLVFMDEKRWKERDGANTRAGEPGVTMLVRTTFCLKEGK